MYSIAEIAPELADPVVKNFYGNGAEVQWNSAMTPLSNRHCTAMMRGIFPPAGTSFRVP